MMIMMICKAKYLYSLFWLSIRQESWVSVPMYSQAHFKDNVLLFFTWKHQRCGDGMIVTVAQFTGKTRFSYSFPRIEENWPTTYVFFSFWIWTHITQNHYARHLSNTSEHTVVYPISIPLCSIRSFFSNCNDDDNWIAGTLMLLCSKDIHFGKKLFCFSLMHIHINHLSHKHFWNQILETIESRRSLNVDRFHLTSTLRHQLPTL